MNKMSKFESFSGRSRFLTWFIALTLTALAAGCGGGGQDPILGTGGGAGITGTGPTVTLVTPLPNATALPINTKIITAAFTKAMDPATLTPATFMLACPAGTAQTGIVGYVASGSVATLTLAANLPANTTCTATITTGARDTSGFALASPFTWTFMTGATPDTTAPTVSSTVNANGAVDVATNTKIAFTFSEVMDPATINATTFTAMQGTTPVAGTVSHTGVTAVFAPASILAANTNYTVTATTGVKDVRGNAMASNFSVSWTTAAAPDTTAPTVTGTIHTNGQTNVAVNANVGATFSEAMDPATITNANFTLKETVSGAAVVGVVSYTGVSAVFNPVNNLAFTTGYTVVVKGGASGVKDLAGNPMAADFTIGWTTGAVADTAAPTVIGTVNANGATNVAVNAAFGAIFSEAMDPLSITNVNYTLTTDAGAVIPGLVSYAGVNAVFRPLSNLAANTHYNVTIKGGVAGVKDLARNPMAADFKIGWTTAAAADTTAPTVTLLSPADLEVGVATNKAPYVYFSEWMDPLTITTDSFKLTDPGGVPVAGTVLNGALQNNALFTPLSNLAPSTTYTGTITTAVKDLAGNPLAANKVWSFTTAASVLIIPPPPIILPPNPTAPDLGEAGRFVILASQNVTGDAASSVSNGDIGILDQARTFMTGFTDVGVSPNLGGFAELTNGMSYAADDLCPAPYQCPLKFSTLPVGATWVDAATMIVQVRTDSQGAFTFLGADPNPGAPTQVAPIELGNLVLTRGVYRNAADIAITTGPLHLDAQGDPNSVFIIVTDGTLTTGAAGSIVLDNLAQARNVYWLSAGITTIAAGTIFYGNAFAVSQVNVLAGAQVTGRLFARNDRVTLISDTVTKAP